MDLQAFRDPAVYAGSFLLVSLLCCCLTSVACLVDFIGKIAIAGLIAVVVKLTLTSQLDRLFAEKQKKKIDSERKAVFISGCDTGFGHELAIRLHRLGFHVYAGCLFPTDTGANQLRDRGSDGRLRVIPCDVTKSDQVEECAGKIRAELRKMKIELWAVVNNAGIAAVSEFEWIPMETYEKILNVNTLGSVRVVKSFLPMLRESRGRILFIASLSGRYAIPTMTAYSMSKHAQIALADGIRRELRKFKIQVCLIEPAGYKTCLADTNVICQLAQKHWDNLSTDVQQSYGPLYREKFMTHLTLMADGKSSPNISEPVDAMIDAITAATPKLRYVPGPVDARIRGKFIPLLPVWLQDLLLSRLSIEIPQSGGSQ